MSPPSPAYVNRALFWLVTTTAVYVLMNGAQLFETILIVPSWTAAPPASLGMFQGPYRLDFKAFWIVLHSLHELTLMLALAFCWHLTTVRRWLLVLVTVHVAVRAWTIVYFAPTIIAFQNMPYSPTIDPGLVEQAARWRALNIVRVALFMAVNLGLVPLIVRVERMRGAAAHEAR